MVTLYKAGKHTCAAKPFNGVGYSYQRLCKEAYDGTLGERYLTHFGEFIVSESAFEDGNFFFTAFPDNPVNYVATENGVYENIEQENYMAYTEFSKLIGVDDHTPIVATNREMIGVAYALNPATYIAAGVGYAQLYEESKVPALALVSIFDEIKNYNICGLGKCKGLDTVVDTDTLVQLLNSIYFTVEREYKLPKQLQLRSTGPDLVYRAGIIDSFIRHGVIAV